MPVFGSREHNRVYSPRPGAYAVISDEKGRIAAVISGGRLYLPGGGIEEGEEPNEALVREVQEETGWLIVPSSEIGHADEYVSVREKDIYIIKQGIFFTARIKSKQVSAETDHEVIWVTRNDFAARAAHESHIWAIGRAVEAG